jgi:hypothetical protein
VPLNYRFHRPHSLLENHRKLAVDNLKRCPVCHTVNSKLNSECFVCRWHGNFDHDSSSVEEGFIELLEQCPELIDCILYIPQPKATLLQRATRWLRRRMRSQLDVEA